MQPEVSSEPGSVQLELPCNETGRRNIYTNPNIYTRPGIDKTITKPIAKPGVIKQKLTEEV